MKRIFLAMGILIIATTAGVMATTDGYFKPPDTEYVIHHDSTNMAATPTKHLPVSFGITVTLEVRSLDSPVVYVITKQATLIRVSGHVYNAGKDGVMTMAESAWEDFYIERGLKYHP